MSMKLFPLVCPADPGSKSTDGDQVEEVLRILGCISSTSRDLTSITAVCRTSDCEHRKICTGGVKFNHGPDVPWESMTGIVVYMKSEDIKYQELSLANKLESIFCAVSVSARPESFRSV
jgi:hypothetical protein